MRSRLTRDEHPRGARSSEPPRLSGPLWRGSWIGEHLAGHLGRAVPELWREHRPRGRGPGRTGRGLLRMRRSPSRHGHGRSGAARAAPSERCDRATAAPRKPPTQAPARKVGARAPASV